MLCSWSTQWRRQKEGKTKRLVLINFAWTSTRQSLENILRKRKNLSGPNLTAFKGFSIKNFLIKKTFDQQVYLIKKFCSKQVFDQKVFDQETFWSKRRFDQQTCWSKFFFEKFLINRSTMTPKTTLWRRRRRKGANGVKPVQNAAKTIQNALKLTRKRSENCTCSDGRIASDCLEIFGLVWLIL